jgi:RNA polymerase sigma factor (sigma-70 family)
MMLLEMALKAHTVDGDSFKEWVSPHLEKMGTLASRLGPPGERDDVVQEALTRAWRSRGSYRESRGSLSAWLCAITANVASSHSRRARWSLGWIEPAAQVRDLDQRLDLNTAIRRLSSRQALAITCHYAVGLSVSETAVVMRCSEGTVKSTLADARSRLRLLLG